MDDLLAYFVVYYTFISSSGSGGSADDGDNSDCIGDEAEFLSISSISPPLKRAEAEFIDGFSSLVESCLAGIL